MVIVNNGTNYAGSHSLTNAEIEIIAGASEQYKEMILAHEILHGIVDATKIDLGDKEEPFVLAMERVFFQFLKDNTNFFNSKDITISIDGAKIAEVMKNES